MYIVCCIISDFFGCDGEKFFFDYVWVFGVVGFVDFVGGSGFGVGDWCFFGFGSVFFDIGLNLVVFDKVFGFMFFFFVLYFCFFFVG